MNSKKLPPDFSALISLLDDPDTEAFRHVREQISALGPVAVAPLEAAWENSFDPVMQQRIEELVHMIQLDQLLSDFRLWLVSKDQDLLNGYLLLTRFQYPDLNVAKVLGQFEHITRDIWLELNNNLTSLEKIKVLNHIIFLVYKFTGSPEPSAPENYFLNILLESRQGSPLSIGMLYLIAAQRLEIPIQGIDLPRHFVVAYTNQVPDQNVSGMDSLEIQFYINPFAKGAVFSRKELSEYLKQINVEPEEQFYLPCTNVQLIRRMILELQEAYLSNGKDTKAEELKRFLDTIDEV